MDEYFRIMVQTSFITGDKLFLEDGRLGAGEPAVQEE